MILVKTNSSKSAEASMLVHICGAYIYTQLYDQIQKIQNVTTSLYE